MAHQHKDVSWSHDTIETGWSSNSERAFLNVYTGWTCRRVWKGQEAVSEAKGNSYMQWFQMLQTAPQKIPKGIHMINSQDAVSHLN